MTATRSLKSPSVSLDCRGGNFAPRVLLAKIGLDGHDRGVKVLARSFRDAGIEVIYTGLWQTCEATMHAALQEDVDVVGVSLLSAAHMTVMPELLRYRKELGIEDLPVVLGGIVPEADYPKLKEMGIADVFNPGSSMDKIIARLKELAAARRAPSVEEIRAGCERGDVRSLARLITAIQRGAGGWPVASAAGESNREPIRAPTAKAMGHPASAANAMDHPAAGVGSAMRTVPAAVAGSARRTLQAANAMGHPAGRAVVIGVTGAPGVGKSSFIARLGKRLRERDKKVAVVAVDPSSPVTGGALLGDRLRMMTGQPDAGFFMRSIASGPVQGGLGPHCREIVAALNGFGFDYVLVETVGAGQADVAVRELTDHIMLLLMPDSGDAVQFSKAGIMEIATCFVVNKCDLAGADATEGQLRSAVGSDRPIWRVSTIRDEGIDEVAAWIVEHGSP